MSRFALVSLLCSIAFAQEPQPPVAGPPGAAASTRIIQGHVVDKKKALVPRATVLLKDLKTLQVRTFLTGADAEYHFYGLDADVNYELRAQGNGLSSKQKTVSVFDSHQVVKLDLKLTRKLSKVLGQK